MPHEDKREDRCEDRLSVALSFLSREVSRLTDQLERTTNQEVILNRIAQLERTIMQAISEYAVRVNTAFDAISGSVDEIAAAQAGLASDVTQLKALIEKLQNTPDGWTPADQETLNTLEVRANGIVAKTAAVSEALKALDAQTEAAPPVEPPTPA